MPNDSVNKEATITSPLKSDQIFEMITKAWDKDYSMMMVTQEILIFLALFISTEPALFDGMIRLRVGLIVQVMIIELKRTLSCDIEEATDHLLNLSPFELKVLLHMILSGKEMTTTSSKLLEMNHFLSTFGN
jgi:phosphorylase kinase alpha/beta subunit